MVHYQHFFLQNHLYENKKISIKFPLFALDPYRSQLTFVGVPVKLASLEPSQLSFPQLMPFRRDSSKNMRWQALLVARKQKRWPLPLSLTLGAQARLFSLAEAKPATFGFHSVVRQWIFFFTEKMCVSRSRPLEMMICLEISIWWKLNNTTVEISREANFFFYWND